MRGTIAVADPLAAANLAQAGALIRPKGGCAHRAKQGERQ